MIRDEFELVVIGAGPAGMEAAAAASEAGVKTAIVDGFAAPGGQYYKRLPGAFTASQVSGVELEGAELEKRVVSGGATQFFSSQTWGVFRQEASAGWLVALAGPEALFELRASALVLATGAYDTPVAFPGWTLPGVITCGAALTLAKSQRVAPGRRALVTGSGPLLLSAAAHLSEVGTEVVAVCETSRPFWKALRYVPTLVSHPALLREAARYYGVLKRGHVPYLTGWCVFEAKGHTHVEEALIGQVDRMGYSTAGRQRSLRVDTVVSGFGLTPNVGLARMIGCQMIHRPQYGGWVPMRDQTMQTNQPGVYAVGDGAGIRGAENARLEGRLAGLSAALQILNLKESQASALRRKLEKIERKRERLQVYVEVLSDIFPQPPGWRALPRDETVLCRCEEISLGEVKAVVQEGAKTLEEVKMVTRAGMGHCQGRMCERLVSEALLAARGQDPFAPELTEQYLVRPPLHPLPLEILAQARPDQ